MLEPGMLDTIAFTLSQIFFPLISISVAIFALIIFFRSQSFRIKAGSIEVSARNREVEEIRKRVQQDVDSAGPSARQFALLKEYHAQGLAQSKVSFWFSLLFAALGFLIIMYSIIFYLGVQPSSADRIATLESTIFSDAQRPIFALVAGTVVEAVAALFFVQSNKARQLMSEFFDKARMDRKLDEALVLASQIDDPMISARLRAYLAMTFAEVGPSPEVLNAIMADASENSGNSASKNA